jgi:hypothetical protein
MATAKSCTVSAALFQGTVQARWYHVCCDDHLVICTCWSFSMIHLPRFLLDQSPIQSVSDLCLFTFRSLYFKQPSASPANTVFPRTVPLSCGLQGQQFLVKMHVSIRGLVNRIRDLHRLRLLGDCHPYPGCSQLNSPFDSYVKLQARRRSHQFQCGCGYCLVG